MSKISKILVVEDHPILLLDLVDQLLDFGMTATPATNAATGARLLDTGIDALITDIELGEGPDGLSLARLAARLRPGLPIVVVSGGVTPRSSDLPAGAVFIPKPYSVAAIVAALEAQVRHLAA